VLNALGYGIAVRNEAPCDRGSFLVVQIVVRGVPSPWSQASGSSKVQRFVLVLLFKYSTSSLEAQKHVGLL
jgi:hypothetical protein